MSAAALIADCQKRLDRLRGGGGWFSTNGGSTIDHGTYRSVVGPYHDRVYYEGRVTWGALVQAQSALYAPGDWDSTGAVVYSFDRHFDANPQQLERIAANVGALKNAMPKDALLVTFAAEVRNDTPREIDRMVPLALTTGKQVRYETIYIQRHRLPTGYLVGQFFPIIISTSQPTQPMLLPLDAWTPELAEMWKAAERKKAAPQGNGGSKPISSQPQRYHGENPHAGRPGPGAGSGAPSGGPAGGSHYGDSKYGETKYGNGGYGTANHAGTGPAHGGHGQSGAQGTAGYGNAGGYGNAAAYGHTPAYRAPAAPAQPDPYVNPASYAPQPTYTQTYANNNYGGQVVAAQPAFVQPAQPAPAPAPAPPPAPRLDPAAEAFAQKPLQLTSAAAGSLKLSSGQQPGAKPRVRVSVADSLHRLDFVSGDPNPTADFVYDSAGVTLVIDLNSARSLTGMQVDFGPSPNGIGFVFRRVA